MQKYKLIFERPKNPQKNFSFLPPRVLGATNGLNDAVHGLTFRNGNGVANVAVGVFPRCENQQFVGTTEIRTSLRRMIDFRKTIVFDSHHGIALLDGAFDDFMLAFCYTGRYKDCPSRSC